MYHTCRVMASNGMQWLDATRQKIPLVNSMQIFSWYFILCFLYSLHFFMNGRIFSLVSGVHCTVIFYYFYYYYHFLYAERHFSILSSGNKIFLARLLKKKRVSLMLSFMFYYLWYLKRSKNECWRFKVPLCLDKNIEKKIYSKNLKKRFC